MTEITADIERGHARIRRGADTSRYTAARKRVFTVMDAHCTLCAKGAAWIAHNDKTDEFRIISIQSALGKSLLRQNDLDPDDPASWLYLEYGQAYAGLDALVRVGQKLGGIWVALSILRVLPRWMRQRLYHTVARNRYRLFGAADLCRLPDPEVKRRLVT